MNYDGFITTTTTDTLYINDCGSSSSGYSYWWQLTSSCPFCNKALHYNTSSKTVLCAECKNIVYINKEGILEKYMWEDL